MTLSRRSSELVVSSYSSSVEEIAPSPQSSAWLVAVVASASAPDLANAASALPRLQLLSFLPPRLLAPSSMPPPRVQLFFSLHCSIDSTPTPTPAPLSAVVASALAPTRLLSILLPRICLDSSRFCWLFPLLSSKPRHALRSSWHDFSTARLLGSARLFGSSAHCSARLSGSSARLGSAARLLVSSARHGSSSARLVGSSARPVSSARLVGSSEIVLLHRQLHTPSGCAPLRPTPSQPRDAPTVIRQRNTLQPRLVFERLRAVYHSCTTSRRALSYTAAHDARLHAYPLPHRSIPPGVWLSVAYVGFHGFVLCLVCSLTSVK